MLDRYLLYVLKQYGTIITMDIFNKYNNIFLQYFLQQLTIFFCQYLFNLTK